MKTLDKVATPNIRKETDSLGEVNVSANFLWCANAEKGGRNVNYAAGRLSSEHHTLIAQTCDEILNRAVDPAEMVRPYVAKAS